MAFEISPALFEDETEYRLKSEYKQWVKVLKNLQEMLLSPQPMEAKVSKRRNNHCPWPVGSLLAYNIISNGELKNHPLYNKYALLRVVKIMNLIYPFVKIYQKMNSKSCVKF